nr:hypothetical protein Q903MT_gene840 [Picea sitchensis]
MSRNSLDKGERGRRGQKCIITYIIAATYFLGEGLTLSANSSFSHNPASCFSLLSLWSSKRFVPSPIRSSQLHVPSPLPPLINK